MFDNTLRILCSLGQGAWNTHFFMMKELKISNEHAAMSVLGRFIAQTAC